MDTKLKHLGIIMDGNGRWATKRRRDRFWGHLRGAKVAQNIIEECSRLNLDVLTLFAFSTENWFRPKEEISFLMRLLKRQLSRERDKLIKNRIRFQIVGDASRLPRFAQEEVKKTIDATKDNTGMTLVFALSYGSRQEITEACREISKRVQEGSLSPEDINEDTVENCLQTRGLPNPDIILRTSGEYRLSNFLLWQAAYSEIFVTDTLWPDFTVKELHQIVQKYEGRERRFGRVGPSLKTSPDTVSPSTPS